MDILLLADIQSLADKESTQEESFHTFKTLHNANIWVSAFASLNRQPVALSLTEIVLKDLIPGGDDSAPAITSTAIMGVTADYFGLTIDDLCGSSRGRQLVTARQIAMCLCRELSDLSLPKIGALLDRRDHTTVCPPALHGTPP